MAQGVEDQPFRERGQGGNGQGRSGQREPVVQPPGRHEVEGDERAGHVEGAVREIRDVQDAVDEGQPQRQAVEHLLQEQGHGSVSPVGLPPVIASAGACRGVAAGLSQCTARAVRAVTAAGV